MLVLHTALDIATCSNRPMNFIILCKVNYKTLLEIFLPSLSLFRIFQLQIKSFINPEIQMSVGLPFSFAVYLNG